MIITGENGKKTSGSDLQESLVLLFDSSATVDQIKKFVDQKIKIIKFDYESNKMLTKNN